MYSAEINLYLREKLMMEKKNMVETHDETDKEITRNSFFNLIYTKLKEKSAEIIIMCFITIITAGISVFISVEFIIPGDISEVNSRVNGLENNLKKVSDGMTNSLEGIKNEIKEKNDSLEEIIKNNKDELKEDIKEAKKDIREENDAFKAGINTKLGIISIKATTFSVSKLNYSTTDLESGYSSGPLLKANGIVGSDSKTGKKYKTKNLINKKILVPYTENGQEVYFLGQYNENYHWDGNCTINVYKKNKLVLITNANYDDGELKNYRQVLEGTNNTWIVSNRKSHKKYNSGESWSYYKDKSIKKKFTIKSAIPSDIIGVDDFKTKYAKKIEGYYNGRTSNGKYNDRTGKAYLVKYFENSTYVRTLYRGYFKNGKFEDFTGNAWYIVKDINTDYMYYKGFFENNTAKYKDDKHFKNHLKKDDIERIIKGYNFSCELKWDIAEEI